MNIGLIAFTKQGRQAGLRLCKELEKQGHVCDSNGLSDGLEGSLFDWTRDQFDSREGLIFIGAAGIAVRAIAPFIRSKTTDPAVVVMDDRSTFAISLLSGHLGGANRLTAEIASVSGAVPVVTTATDRNGVFSVDEWANSQGLTIDSMELVKKVSRALLEGEQIGFSSDYPWQGDLPRGLLVEEDGGKKEWNFSIRISPFRPAETKTLHLIAKKVVLGIGCRKGIGYEELDQTITDLLSQENLDLRSVGKVASIDLKKEEPGLRLLCDKKGWIFETFSPRELSKVEGSITPSDFVKAVTGVDNVCERAALQASKGGRLLLSKRKKNGVTVAASELALCLTFS